ncbi:hypothetical protein BGZ63DRAFT_476946 [Mariannaea sp. PMI_226]|nr:hypothetical protein BGZ63DRAFT_476946 [Mariannaea sp. PMI_226]
MAPSAKKLEEALLDGTFEVYSTTPDETTVNKVRKHVEEKLGLEEGFFLDTKWKAKSKTLIKARVEKLMDGWEPEKKGKASSNLPSKRRSSGAASPEPKRRKPAPKPKKPAKQIEESDLSELSGLSEKEEEKPKPKNKKAATSQPSKKVESDDDELSDPPSTESLDLKLKQDNEPSEIKNGENDSGAPPDDEKTSSHVKFPVITLGDAVEDSDTVTPRPVIDEEEEYSDVIDEPPKPKRKKKEQKDKGEPSSKRAKPAKTATKKASVSEDPQEAEIKKLQSQLTKCGIRKLWHNELKKYGDDPRAKIRHLKKMLSDVGMDGRFSEAKAREIKEMRELMAEAEAAKEMNALWGVDNGRRASRSKTKTSKTVESEASDNEAEEEEEEEDNTYAARRKRAQADLAFLGDDSDSD